MEQIQDLGHVNKFVDEGIQLGMAYAPKLLLAIITLVVGLWIINHIAAGLERAFERGGMDDTLRKFIRHLVNIGLKALLLISVASMVGIATTSFIAVLAAAGLAVGLALQGSLANFAGGVLILIFRPFKVGDFIDSSGQAGTVREISIFHTIMTTPDNKTVIVPNGALSNGSITNFSTQATRRVEAIFGIGYDDDLKAAKEIIKRLMEADDRILTEPEPLVVISSLGDNSVNITSRGWVNSSDFFPVLWDLTENVKLAFDESGITIPYPQRDVHIYNESA